MTAGRHRPNTPGTRFRTEPNFDDVTKSEPEKNLTKSRKRISGRNCHGRQTMRRRGGGVKRRIRIVDFTRNKIGIPGRIAAIEYDPTRTARIALVHYVDGEKRYMVAPAGAKVGQLVNSGSQADVKSGNALPLRDIPVGEFVHNIEIRPGGGGKICRSAGTQAQLMAKDGAYALIRLPSGEQRRVLLSCMATIGTVSNSDHFNRTLGKAGANRWRGRRPKVRGVAQNPVDHPMGGGEGRTSGGRHPCSPFGLSAKGKKTRNNKRTDKFIVRRRRV